jgi:hypothetical protein
MKNNTAILLLASLSLGACAMQEGEFPSLAKRAIEDVGTDGTTAGSPTRAKISTLPVAEQAKLQKALADSDAAHILFLSKLPAVQEKVKAARGAAELSEKWVVAQLDLAALEIDRSPSVEALADTDALYLARLDSEFEDAAPGGAAIIAERKKRIEQQVIEQQTEIDLMKAQLR